MRRVLIAIPVVLLLLVGSLFLPPVQRQIALSVLRGAVPGEAEVEGVRLRPGSASVSGLRLGLGPGHLTLASAEVHFRTASLWGDAPEISSVRVSGLVFDLTRPDPSHKSEPLEGVIGEIPQTAIRLDQLDLDARIVLAADQALEMKVSGGGLKPGAEGRFRVESRVTGAQPVSADMDITVTDSADGVIEALAARGTLRAPLSQQTATLAFAAESRRDGAQERFVLRLGRPDADPILAATATGPFSTATAQAKLAWSDADRAWLETLLGTPLPAATLSGDLTLVCQDDDRLSLKGAMEGAWQGRSWVRKTLDVKITPDRLEALAEGDLDLAPLAPVLAEFLATPPAAGNIHFRMQANGPSDPERGWPTVALRAEAERLADAAAQPLPSLQLTAQLAPEAGNRGTLQAELRVTNGGRVSDLNVGGTLALGEGNAPVVTATVRSQRINLSDLQLLADAFSQPATAEETTTPPAGAPATPPAAPAAGARPAKPQWAPLTGKLDLQLAQVDLPVPQRLSHLAVVRNVRLEADLADAALDVPQLSAQLGNQPLVLRTRLAFDPAAPAAYALTGDLAWEQLQLASLLPTQGQSNLLEGTFTLRGNFSARADDPLQLTKTLNFQVEGQGTEGHLRLLQAGEGGNSALPGLAGAVGGALSGLLGNRGGSPAPTETLSRLVQLFQDIPYRSFSFTAKREDGPAELSLFEFNGDEIRLQSMARASFDPSLALTQQPFELPIRIAVRGRAAYLLDQAALLTGQQLGDGWYEGPTYTQSGTLAAPRNNLRDLFTQALLGSLTGRRLGLTETGTTP